MKIVSLSRPVMSAVILCVMLLLEGCTLLFVGMGTVADNAKKNRHVFKAGKHLYLDPGQQVLVITVQGDTLEALYKGPYQIPSDDYQDSLNAYYSSDRFPRIGDTLEIYFRISRTGKKGVYQSFDDDYIYLLDLQEERTFSAVMDPVFIDIRGASRSYSVSEMKELPSFPYIILSDPNGNEKLYCLSDIISMEAAYSRKHSAKIIVGAIGLVLDTFMVLLMTGTISPGIGVGSVL